MGCPLAEALLCNAYEAIAGDCEAAIACIFDWPENGVFDSLTVALRESCLKRVMTHARIKVISTNKH